MFLFHIMKRSNINLKHYKKIKNGKVFLHNVKALKDPCQYMQLKKYCCRVSGLTVFYNACRFLQVLA